MFEKFLKMGEGPKFSEKLVVSEFIVKDAKGKNFELGYLGSGYQFNSGKDHWRYLFWWKGNEPTLNAYMKYTIAEDPYDLKGKFDKVYNFNKIKVGVKEKYD